MRYVSGAPENAKGAEAMKKFYFTVTFAIFVLSVFSLGHGVYLNKTGGSYIKTPRSGESAACR